MKKSSTLFLKTVILFFAIFVFAGLILFPQVEGRASGLNTISIYSDPFIIYIYIASTPFFFGMYQTIKLLNLIDANKAFSQEAINKLKAIKFSSLGLIGMIAMTLIYIRFFVQGDDSSGPTMLGIILLLAFSIIATAAGVFQKLFQNAVDMKSENDLTV